MTSETERSFSDPRPDEPMAAVFSSSNHDGEWEAMTIKGILEASGIPTILAGPHVLPNLEFQVQVPEHMLGEARRLIMEARLAGPEAAEQGEREGEAAQAAGRPPV